MRFPAPFWHRPLVSFDLPSFYHLPQVMFVEIVLKGFVLIYSHCRLQFEMVKVSP